MQNLMKLKNQVEKRKNQINVAKGKLEACYEQLKEWGFKDEPEAQKSIKIWQKTISSNETLIEQFTGDVEALIGEV